MKLCFLEFKIWRVVGKIVKLELIEELLFCENETCGVMWYEGLSLLSCNRF